MADAKTFELLASSEQSSSSTGEQVDIGQLRRAARLEVNLAPVIGSPEVTIECRPTETAQWHVALSVVATDSEREFFAGNLDRYVRARVDLDAGTTVQLGITLEAHTIYCSPGDITTYGLPKQALGDIDSEQLWSHCVAASVSAEDYIGSAYEMPLTAWPRSLAMHCARLAAANILRDRGTDPEGPDQTVFDTEKASIRWFEQIANGKLRPPGFVDSTPETFDGGSVVVTNPTREW
jgi:phage gp36-like protein